MNLKQYFKETVISVKYSSPVLDILNIEVIMLV